MKALRLVIAAWAAYGLMVLIAPAIGWADEASPAGLWRTFDDKTGRERGLVRIWEQDGILYGSVAGTIDPAEAKRTCDKCRDDRHDKPILGLNIIRGMKRDGDRWAGGQILDPETGKTYRCSMRLQEAGSKLVVRGYLGISLLGRSQIWVRAQ
jgi:uncharacterized protein (DUF2147 family)